MDLLPKLEEKYGNITRITNIQLKDCEYYFTVETEKAGTVYFSINAGDRYKYSPESDSWKEHIYAGLTEESFRTEPFEFSNSETSYETNSFQEKLGKIMSINIISHYKYEVDALITIENKVTPISVRLSLDYDGYCDINTYDLSWNSVFKGMDKDYLVDFLMKFM